MDVTFRNASGRTLAGSLQLPAGVECPPVVVFAHGFGSGQASSRNRAIAELLVRRGIAAFLFDFTGHGLSQGVREEATADQMVEDLGAALDFIESCVDVDPRRIGISGSSSGGIVTTLFAARDHRPQALVLRSVPAGDLFEPASRIDAPTLVIAGDDDVPIVEEDRAFAEALHGPHQFVVIPAAGHLFEGPGQAEQVAALSADWFVAHLAVIEGA